MVLLSEFHSAKKTISIALASDHTMQILPAVSEILNFILERLRYPKK
jgi:hypothetical protein